ncbi:hypothetical protein KF947_11525 [Halomonas sp. FeN2]|uniref:hypothetical protein n=1 Tax=Halomonas sp. FeN2 TaxID=2832500 RepID=UPI000C5E4DF9|nr:MULTISPECIES: hypothetical protein [unclassified Halomonas]MBF56955.1 hypothetical protein [Halomonas sp.]UBR48013.1 hypothetical protein KF947_11525 [Halomonas sp. FeN2]|tara:strand:+ start:5221 stop:6261 length:1041 start_codon:yes stop_codon:yes gene_type:complete
MKLQLTVIAAAIALSASAASLADARDPVYEVNGNTMNNGKGAFDQQGVIRSDMDGWSSLNIDNGTAGVRETDHEQINQTGSTLNSAQAGTEQYSEIIQSGPYGGSSTGNEAYVDQGQNGGGSEENVSLIKQINGSTNKATVYQKGNGFNESRVVQINGDANTAAVNQYGMNDQSDISQSYGDHNTATVNQYNGEYNQSIIIQRNGDWNKATVEQRNSNWSDSYIEQNGFNNTADVSQRNNSDYSDSIIRQSGDYNEAEVDQQNNSDQTWSFIEQRDNNHLAEVTQNNADLSASYIYQGGNSGGHEAYVTQQNEYSSVSMVRQNGTTAIANHTQTGGSGNVASSYQW